MKTAYLDGWLAHKAGKKTEMNPFNEETQAMSHSLWLNGWSDRHSRHKHELGNATEHDNAIWA